MRKQWFHGFWAAAAIAVAATGFSASDANAGTRCENAVQQVAWNYEGNRNWNMTNVRRLCGGRRGNTAPAECFRRVMHGNVNWGQGTRWKWENAINLCENTPHGQAPVMCFRAQMMYGRGWSEAIRRCKY